MFWSIRHQPKKRTKLDRLQIVELQLHGVLIDWHSVEITSSKNSKSEFVMMMSKVTLPFFLRFRACHLIDLIHWTASLRFYISSSSFSLSIERANDDWNFRNVLCDCLVWLKECFFGRSEKFSAEDLTQHFNFFHRLVLTFAWCFLVFENKQMATSLSS